MTSRCIIVGGSHAAAQLAPSLRQEGWEGEILIVSDSGYLPYHRPPLSKAFLAGNKSIEDLEIRPRSFYEKHNVEFKLDRASAIDREQKVLALESGAALSYDKLVICTGARVRKLSNPGSDLKGIHYLRDIDDVEALKADIGANKRGVIVGGGYIGLEMASSMRKQGMEVTVLEMAPRVLQRVAAPELSQFYSRVHKEEGVDVRTGMSVSAFEGDSYVSKVICEDGSEFLADVVVIGVGVIPNVELAAEAGIAVDNGILVNEHCCSSDGDIYAAGDCTNHFNKMYQCNIRLESVPNANEQAKVVASAVCGGEKEYSSLPWFWSDQFDLKLQIAGLNTGYDSVYVRGDSESGRSFAAFYFKGGKLVSSDCVNRPQEFMLSKKIISNDLQIAPERLMDESIAVKDLL